MSCEYCDLEVGKEYGFENLTVCCMSCGFTLYVGDVNTFHKYKDKEEHHFNVLKNVNCPECNNEINFFKVPHGGSYYFNGDEVSKSLLLPQEFITRE